MEDIYAKRQKLAKRANQRLRALEKHGYGSTWAATTAYKDLERLYKLQRMRFSEGQQKGMTRRRVQREIAALEHFLDLKTSTLKGVRSGAMKQMETLERRYGITFKNVQEYEMFVVSSAWDKMSSLYGSKDAMIIIGQSKLSIPEKVQYMEDVMNTGGSVTRAKMARSIGLKGYKNAMMEVAKFRRKQEGI